MKELTLKLLNGVLSADLPDGGSLILRLELHPAPPAVPEPPVVVTPEPPAPPPVVTPEPIPPVVTPEPPPIPPVVTPEPPVIILPPPAPTIPPLPGAPILPPLPPGKVWEPAITVKSGDKLEGRFFWNDTEGPCFTLPSNTVLPEFVGVTAISRGPMFSGWRVRLKGHDSSYRILPPVIAGKPPARFWDLQEFMDIDFHHNDVDGVGRGLFMTGLVDNNPKARQFAGDPAKGDRLRVYRNHLHNADGQISDGKGGRIRSLWVATHKDNAVRIKLGGVIGREVSNYLQISKLLGIPGLIEWNLCTGDLGSNVEDGFSVQNSAGLPGDPLVIQYNWIWNTGAPDLDYVPGVSKSYNGSNKVLTNPTSPQDPTQTGYSGTCGIIEGVDPVYDRNPHDIVWRGNVGAGYRAIFTQQGGHHNTWEDGTVYLTDQHLDGVPWAGNPEAWFQMTNYRVGRMATDNGKPVWDANTFNRQTEYNAKTEGGILAVPADILKYGGRGEGNVKRLAVKDGGKAALKQWWADAHQGGQTVGRRF